MGLAGVATASLPELGAARYDILVMPRSRALALGLLLAASPLHAATIASVFSGRIPCSLVQGVQFCSGDLTNRIESFDGVPLDTNVTLPPASMDGPFPLIVDLHGWSLGKTATCGKKPCWKAAGDGFTYADAKSVDGSAERSPDDRYVGRGERDWTRPRAGNIDATHGIIHPTARVRHRLLDDPHGGSGRGRALTCGRSRASGRS
jgi:hypothetical protein